MHFGSCQKRPLPCPPFSSQGFLPAPPSSQKPLFVGRLSDFFFSDTKREEMARELCLDDRDPPSKDAKLAPVSDGCSTGVKAPDDEEQSIHVLAVDDSLLDRKVIERLLKTSSYRVTTVDSGRRALEVLGLGGTQELVNSNVHLIITDYCMPEMSGYDLLKKVKETPALKDIPVVIMSSENVPSRIQMCLTDGAEEFILKPVRMTDVKRLKDYVNLPKQAPSEPSGPSCNKRKFGSDGCQAQSPERRPRLSGVTVA